MAETLIEIYLLKQINHNFDLMSFCCRTICALLVVSSVIEWVEDLHKPTTRLKLLAPRKLRWLLRLTRSHIGHGG
jgi:hypothetical protein